MPHESTSTDDMNMNSWTTTTLFAYSMGYIVHLDIVVLWDHMTSENLARISCTKIDWLSVGQILMKFETKCIWNFHRHYDGQILQGCIFYSSSCWKQMFWLNSVTPWLLKNFVARPSTATILIIYDKPMRMDLSKLHVQSMRNGGMHKYSFVFPNII